jgi:hypothetical protein
MKSRVFTWIVGVVLVLAVLFLLMNTVNYKLNGTGWQISNGYGYGYGGDNPPSELCSEEQKLCGTLCCAKTDKCDPSFPVCCPEGYKISHGVCVVDCPKDKKSCTWGCCPKKSICGAADGLCIINKECPAGTTDCPSDDPKDGAKDCCKPSETCMSVGRLYTVYICSANSCEANQELCGIDLPPGTPKLPVPGNFAICCDKGKCAHFPAGQPYCIKSNNAKTSAQEVFSSPSASNSKSTKSAAKTSFWKNILKTFKVE